MTYKICNLIIETNIALPSFTSFRKEGEADMVIVSARGPSVHLEDVRAAHPDFAVYQTETGWVYETPFGEQMSVDRAYTRVQLWCPPESAPGRNVRVLLLIRLAIECRLAYSGVLSLHGACIIKEGKSLVFTGDSGQGKSTRAGQWVDALGAQWLSGDRPAIDVRNMTAYGVPWDGKEQVFCSCSAPLMAVLDVRRASFTRLRKMTQSQIRRVLMSQCFIPMWDSDTAVVVMSLIFQLAQQLSMGRLFCDMDEKAAEETYELLYRQPQMILQEEADLKIKEGFVLRQLVGEYMVMPTGDNVARFEGAVALNEVAAFLFEKLMQPVCKEDLLSYLMDEYEVEAAVAERDLEILLDIFRSYDMLQELP